MKLLAFKSIIIFFIITLIACYGTSSKDEPNNTTDKSSTGKSFEEPIVKSGHYYNLNSGERIKIIADSLTGLAIDSSSNMLVEFYLDKTTKDTFYQTGLKVNHLLIKNKDGSYTFDERKVKINGEQIIIF